MRNSWTERIIVTLLIGICVFIFDCVITKLYAGRPDWLFYSLICSVSWTAGLFISKTITAMDKSIWKIIGIDLMIIFLSFILLAFAFGVVADMANWDEIVYASILSFGVSMITGNEWKRN